MSDPRDCPLDIQASILAYIQGRPTGGFLQAVLENNLVEAVMAADAHNGPLLGPITAFVYHTVPHGHWGSALAVSKYLKAMALAKKRGEMPPRHLGRDD